MLSVLKRSSRDGSFEHPKHMLKITGKKYLQFYAKKLCLSKPMLLLTEHKDERICNFNLLKDLFYHIVHQICTCIYYTDDITREPSGSVVECLTRDRRAAGSSLTGALRCVLEQEH